jgi:AraC family transcriptional regulator, ethanolamine operon transcriptional activator
VIPTLEECPVASLTSTIAHRLRPTPGITARAPSARSALFPAGLVVDVLATTGEELRAASVGWDARYAQLAAGRLRGRAVAVHTASVQVCVEDCSLSVLKRGRAPRGSVTFLVPIGGRDGFRIQGRPVAAGGVVVLFDAEELDYRSAGPAGLVSVSIERAALEGHVRALIGRPLGELRLQGRLSGLRADGETLSRLGHELAARAAVHPGRLRDPALASQVEARLVKLLFAGLGAPYVAATPRRGRALAQRAEAWLRQNLAEPPTIATLCGALNAHERTLHEAFREHLGTTPKAYLKTLRLNAARHDLLRGGAKTRVTDVALDWGFLHFGWFSQDYRRLFGETPSQTLHRGRTDARSRGFGYPGPRNRTAESGDLAVYAM